MRPSGRSARRDHPSAQTSLTWGSELRLLRGRLRSAGEARQFGVLCVLEGSRLGAKVLRRLLSVAGLPALPPLRYLRNGEGLPLWHMFLERLESSEAVRRSSAAARDGVLTAFAWFGANTTA